MLLPMRLTLTDGRLLPGYLEPLSKFIRSQAIGRLFTYWADGVATVHYCPFVDDPEFEAAYREMAKDWIPGADTRWRMWLLTILAQQCQDLPGNFAEFGTWRGGCAYMVLDRTAASPDRRFFLFDTFTGIPDDRLTEGEREGSFSGIRSNTSVQYVDNLLARWRGRYELCPGDIFDTLEHTDVGTLSFAHIDLNAAAPTKLALEFAYKTMMPGGIIVFDDYGWASCHDQRVKIDGFFAERREKPVGLPTGQAFVVKR